MSRCAVAGPARASASAPSLRPVPSYVALLRGINLGPRRRLAMADLRTALEGLGYDDVRTHLQSGNAVFRTGTRSATAVKKAVEGAVSAAAGFDVDVVVRTSAQLAQLVTADPFGGVATDPARYLVVFLDRAPAKRWLAELDLDAFAPEQLAVYRNHLVLWLPHGVHASKLAARAADSKAGGAATARNWKVVTKLAQLAAT